MFSTIGDRDPDNSSVANLTGEKQPSQRISDSSLHQPTQRSCPIAGVESLVHQPLLGVLAHVEG